MASACFGLASSARGANQMAIGINTDRTRPNTTTDIRGPRLTAAGAIGCSAIVSVVKESRLPEDIIENFLAPRIQRNQRQSHLGRPKQSNAIHHVFERAGTRVEKN